MRALRVVRRRRARDTCQAGICSDSCTHQCSAAGAFECYENGAKRRICGDFDTDPCRDWTPIEPCPAGLRCQVNAPSGDPCVVCGHDTDCAPAVATCVDFDCEPPPGQCFVGSTPVPPEPGVPAAPGSAQVTSSGSVSALRLFLGVSGLMQSVDGMLLWLAAPDGTEVAVISCTPLPAGDLFWGVLDDGDNAALAQLLGSQAAGTWQLRYARCAADDPLTVDTWAVCIE